MLRHLPSHFKLNNKPIEWLPGLGTEIEEVVVAVMGMTGAGKSSLIKTVTGRDDIVIGHGLKSSWYSIFTSRPRALTSLVL